MPAPHSPEDTPRHQHRDLAPEEPHDPTEAWIERADGTRVDLMLARTGPDTWEASPPPDATQDPAARPPARVVHVGPGDHLRLDRLGPGQSVTFNRVVDPTAKTPE